MHRRRPSSSSSSRRTSTGLSRSGSAAYYQAVSTYFQIDRFWGDFHALRAAQSWAFRIAVDHFFDGLESARPFRSGLRVKGVRGAPGVYEMTWAPDGRATFEYGVPVRPGHPRILWRQIGTHKIFDHA